MAVEFDPALKSQADAVRGLLAEALEVLAGLGSDAGPIRQALLDLEGPFLIVAAGEFNSGKSSLLNALLGEDILKEGVTPTTDRILLLAYGPSESTSPEPDLAVVTHPHPLLKMLRLVDTPGTNAVIERHQILTERFLPRADLILFVTSADRPYTDSERNFLKLIRSWGKKVVLVVNKADLLNETEQEEVHRFVETQAERTLDHRPPVFLVSAKTGQGLADLEAHIQHVLRHEAARIKLGSPLGVLIKLLDAARADLTSQAEEVQEALKRCQALKALLERHERQTREDIRGKIAELSQAFREVEARGERWFRETVRLGRIFDLLNATKVQKSFERDVLGDLERTLGTAFAESQTWIARRERDLLAAALDLLQGTSPKAEEDLLDLEATLKDALDAFSPEAESARVQSQVEAALRATALAEVGAVGLGATIALALHGLAADITGLTAGVAAAILGLSVLPRRREAAFQKFKARLADLEQSVTEALEQALESAIREASERFQGIYSPACAKAQAEAERSQRLRAKLAELEDRARALQAALSR